MKRNLLAIFTLLLVCTSLQAQKVYKGDMNDDGNVNVTDISQLVQHVLQNKPFISYEYALAGTWRSVDGDKFVLNADGTCQRGSASTFVYNPFQKLLYFYNSSSLMVEAYNVVEVGQGYFELQKVGSERPVYYYNSAFFINSISLSESSVTLNTNETKQLTATTLPIMAISKNLTWESSNEAVATVSGAGLITGVGGGSSTITCSASDDSEVSASCSVNVNQSVTDIVLSSTSLTLQKDSYKKLTATVSPSNANDLSVTWTSSNEDVVEVMNGMVMAIGAGTATVTCTANDGSGVSATCNVKIVNQLVTGITLSDSEITVYTGGTYTLTATISPTNVDDSTLVWSSSNTSIATVNPKGVVKGIAEGSATITATASDGSGAMVTCMVTITNHEYVEIGGIKWATMNLGATTVAGSPSTCYGDYYAWGETEPRYTSITISDAKTATFGGWSSSHSSGYSNSDYPSYTGTTLDADHDAATQNWGSSWRTPTNADFLALANACTGSTSDQSISSIATSSPTGGIYGLSSTQTYLSEYTGVAGILFVDKKQTSKRVFFPAAGRCPNTSVNSGGSDGYYWSSVLSSSYYDTAYELNFSLSVVLLSGSFNSYIGYSVRPVSE